MLGRTWDFVQLPTTRRAFEDASAVIATAPTRRTVRNSTRARIHRPYDVTAAASTARRSRRSLPELVRGSTVVKLIVLGTLNAARRSRQWARSSGSPIGSRATERPHRLAPLLVRHAVDGRLEHGGMRFEDRLDLAGETFSPPR